MTKEELKQKAIDFMGRINKESDGMWFSKYFLTDLLVMFATENGILWHDLREDPNDLPKVKRKVLVQLKDVEEPIFDYYREDGLWNYALENEVIAWCEPPKFEEAKQC